MAKSKLARYRKKRPTKNPITESAFAEFGLQVGAGFAGYTATRLLMRMAYSQAVKRWPNFAQHLGVLTSAVGATGIYFGTKHWEKIDDYHESATIGAGIAVLQSILQTYVPKLGWIVSDMDASQYVKPNLPEADLDELSGFSGIEDPPDDTPQIASSFDRLLAENNDLEAIPYGTSDGTEEMAMADYSDAGDDDLEHFNGMMN